MPDVRFETVNGYPIGTDETIDVMLFAGIAHVPKLLATQYSILVPCVGPAIAVPPDVEAVRLLTP